MKGEIKTSIYEDWFTDEDELLNKVNFFKKKERYLTFKYDYEDESCSKDRC